MNRGEHATTRARVFAVALLGVALFTASLGFAQEHFPTLDRIHTVTISSVDPQNSAERYRRYIGYSLLENGHIDASLAEAWQAPLMAGRPYALLQSPDPQPTYIRFVQISPQESYRPVSSAGWNALELLVRDPYLIHDALKDSPFKHLDGPAPLMEGSTIHAVQYLGPDQEVLYLTADLAQDTPSTLARTLHRVGRPFIVVLAGSRLDPLSTFYRDTFGLTEAFRVELPIPFIAAEQKRPLAQGYPLALLRLKAFSHSIEIDAYPAAPPRVQKTGELPPGISVVTFCTTPGAKATTIPELGEGAEPAMATNSMLQLASAPYKGQALRVLRGAAGELIEVLDCTASKSADPRSDLH